MYIKFKDYEFKMDNFYLLSVLSNIIVFFLVLFMMITLLIASINKNQKDNSSMMKNNVENALTNDNQQIAHPSK
jgi:preprotein translocase subunit SecG